MIPFLLNFFIFFFCSRINSRHIPSALVPRETNPSFLKNRRLITQNKKNTIAFKHFPSPLQLWSNQPFEKTFYMDDYFFLSSNGSYNFTLNLSIIPIKNASKKRGNFSIFWLPKWKDRGKYGGYLIGENASLSLRMPILIHINYKTKWFMEEGLEDIFLTSILLLLAPLIIKIGLAIFPQLERPVRPSHFHSFFYLD